MGPAQLLDGLVSSMAALGISELVARPKTHVPATTAKVGAEQGSTWLDRWDLPSCWMALSADQGSSMVRCTLRRWFLASLLACREMPVLAASDTMATSFWPRMKAAAHTHSWSQLGASLLSQADFSLIG